MSRRLTSAPSPTHQTISRRLQFALMKALEESGVAYVFDAPVDVILSDTTVLQPDLAIVAVEAKATITSRGIESAPRLVVEILSPSTSERDKHLKRSLYERHGVEEYWVVDPEEASVEVLVLEGRRYTRTNRYDRSSVLVSETYPRVTIALSPIFAPL